MYTVVFRSSETCKKSWMLAPHGSWTCHPVHVWCHPADVDEKDPHRVGISVQSHQVDVTGWELAVLPGIYRFRFFVNRFFYPLDRIINKSGSILRWICWGDKSDGSMKFLGKRNYVVNFKNWSSFKDSEVPNPIGNLQPNLCHIPIKLYALYPTLLGIYWTLELTAMESDRPLGFPANRLRDLFVFLSMVPKNLNRHIVADLASYGHVDSLPHTDHTSLWTGSCDEQMSGKGFSPSNHHTSFRILLSTLLL